MTDTVTAYNVTNQMFLFHQVGMTEEAIIEILHSINLMKSSTWKYVNQPLSGYIFLVVDNIDLPGNLNQK